MNLNRLNDHQKKAALHVSGPLLILAGAGSGKTQTMTHRIVCLIEKSGIPARHILALSFTNKAALEFRERIQKLLPAEKSRGLTVGTFHSVCARILREFGPLIGLSKAFAIADSSDQVGLMRDLIRHIKLDDGKFDPVMILSLISRKKNGSEWIFKKGDEFDTLLMEDLYTRYEESLRSRQWVDFDDLLVLCLDLIKKHREVKTVLSDRFKYVLVDEYQDTNGIQFEFLRQLTESHRNLCVVGDDDQSIYTWRGADPTHILQFKKQFPEAQVITLEQNYRSTQTILDAANAVIVKNKTRFPKKLWSDLGEGDPLLLTVVEDDRSEAEWVAEKCGSLHREDGVQWSDMTILYRSNPQSRILEEVLREEGIPYKLVGAFSFLDRKEVKDLLSYWKIVLNPKDDGSFRRIANWPARGLGKSSLEKINLKALEGQWGLLEALPLVQDDLSGPAKKGAKVLLELIEIAKTELVSMERAPRVEWPELMASWSQRFMDRVGFRKVLFEEDENPLQASVKADNVYELGHGLGAFVKRHSELDSPRLLLQEYLAHLTLESLDEEEEIEENKVTLMTFHGSKGLEFDNVFLVGLDEGLFPHRRAVEEGRDLSEERRLFYVALTRAKKRLFLVRTKNRIRWGKAVPQNPSRFIEEIPPEMLQVRNETTGGLSGPQSDKDKERQIKHEARVKSYLEMVREKLREGSKTV